MHASTISFVLVVTFMAPFSGDASDVTSKKLRHLTMEEENADLRARLDQMQEANSKTKRSDDSNPLEAVVAQLTQKVTSLTAELEVLKTSHGVAGGSWYADEGGASNKLCLSLKPQFDSATPLSGYHNNLHGAEYYIPGHSHTDAMCAVCRTPHPTTVMVPGTHTCPPGWTIQYTGHITAGHYSYNEASEFLCLDGQPEDRIGSESNSAGAYFMYTVTVCGGSLPCPPYVGGKVVTCAVCSK